MERSQQGRRTVGLTPLVAGLVASLALLAGTARAAGGIETGIYGAPVEQMKALTDSRPTTGGGAPQAITPMQAYQAASERGATVEVADGLSLEQAVGLAATASTTAPLAAAPRASTASVACWRWAPWVRWGTWPWHQKVVNDFSWCAVYGDHITSWSSHVSLDAYLCGYSGAYGYKQVGGAGYGVVRHRAGGYFSCASPYPFITYHYNRWFDTSFYTRGSAAIVASS
jgi:hypothetical protein